MGRRQTSRRRTRIVSDQRRTPGRRSDRDLCIASRRLGATRPRPRPESPRGGQVGRHGGVAPSTPAAQRRQHLSRRARSPGNDVGCPLTTRSTASWRSGTALRAPLWMVRRPTTTRGRRRALIHPSSFDTRCPSIRMVRCQRSGGPRGSRRTTSPHRRHACRPRSKRLGRARGPQNTYRRCINPLSTGPCRSVRNRPPGSRRACSATLCVTSRHQPDGLQSDLGAGGRGFESPLPDHMCPGLIVAGQWCEWRASHVAWNRSCATWSPDDGVTSN